MPTTRDRILETLLIHPRSTINQLAQAVGINGISVRHHLSTLQADALVTNEEERHGVGRPRMVYLLTDKGRERFPTNYLRLTNLLLDQMTTTLSEAVVIRLFEQIGANMAASQSGKLTNLTMPEKLNLIQKLLEEEGFTIQWEKRGDQYLIHEITCPYFHIGQQHPEVCRVDQAVISSILAIPAEKVQCVLRGDSRCTYIIPGMSRPSKMERVK